MGYWTIAPSLLATGVQVFARSGPDFSAALPDLVTQPWVFFVKGKAKADPSVACFRHEDVHQPPDVLCLSGCKAFYSRYNGLYHNAAGVTIGSRPVFIRDGHRGPEDTDSEERMLLHFSQRSGRWMLSSAIATRRPVVRIRGDPDASGVEWRDMRVLAISPVAWTSMSPVHRMPRQPWAVLSKVPSPVDAGLNASLASAKSTDAFESYPDLRVAKWAGRASRWPLSRSLSRTSSAGEDIGMDAKLESMEDPVKALQTIICIHFQSPLGITDPYHLNGDYVRTEDHYSDRPVFIKLPMARPRESGAVAPALSRGRLALFFDDTSGRWLVAPEMGAVDQCVARSPVGWDATDPGTFEKALWQLKVSGGPSAELAPSAHQRPVRGARVSRGRGPAAVFRDCADLNVAEVVSRFPARTIVACGDGDGVAHAVSGHFLSGDFRLAKECFGCRPVYVRAAQVPHGSPALHIFFEPRSGYWVMSTGSPLSVRSDAQDVSTPGFFGEIYARSGPCWDDFAPNAAAIWEVFDRSELAEQELLEYSGTAPNTYLSNLFTIAPWLRLQSLQLKPPPRFLCAGGFGDRMALPLAGTYELLDVSSWSSRPAWRRLEAASATGALAAELGPSGKFVKYIFFWPETGHWLIGPELHVASSALARTAPERWHVETPDLYTSRWHTLNGKVFREDVHVRPHCRGPHDCADRGACWRSGAASNRRGQLRSAYAPVRCHKPSRPRARRGRASA
eukprot:TRINITY_DN16719_c0_g2_i3.p1 TRINITY_DN16719_c0_g2~~TRINITY_DN16719_c0_g2_i3.p1  ORF type:complete len:794 (-),score=102.48 TRINITY_DN16719_c0_g2_i3:959-3160(-)